MLVVGGPQSGKSTLLRTLISSFALTHTPHEVQFYGLDFGGGGMSPMADLPHVGGVASRLDPERVRRTVAEVVRASSTAARSTSAPTASTPSPPTGSAARARRAAGPALGRRLPRHRRLGQLQARLRGAGAESSPTSPPRGLGYGVHVVITASRYMEVRAGAQGPAAEPAGAAARRPDGLRVRPQGRGERPAGRARPRPDPGEAALHGRRCRGSTASTRDDDLVRRPRADLVARRSTPALAGSRAPRPYGCCRASCRADQLPKGFEHPERGVAIGIDENNLEPVFVDFETDPFFLVFGESESGKTALLRLLTKQITERYTPGRGEDRRRRLPPLPAGRHPAVAPAGVRADAPTPWRLHMERARTA